MKGKITLATVITLLLAWLLLAACQPPGTGVATPTVTKEAEPTVTVTVIVTPTVTVPITPTVTITAGTPSPAEPLLTLPAEPRTADGKNPFDLLPPPVACAPQQANGPVYTEMASLPQEQIPNPYVPDGFSVLLEYQNSGNQIFRISIHGATETAVRDYIGVARLCLEAAGTNTAPPITIEPVRLDAILLETITELTDATLPVLVEQQNALGDPDGVTLNDILAAMGVDLAQLLDAASERAAAAISAAVADGRLTAEEVAALDPREAMAALLAQPDATFLIPPADLPTSDEEYGRLITEDQQTLLVELDIVEPVLEQTYEFWVAWYAIDPPIQKNKGRYYRAKCQSSAWSQIYVDEGKATNVLWRQPWAGLSYLYVGSSTASADAYSTQLYHSSSPSNGQYDTYVKGEADGSDYTMYGGWTEGSGVEGSCG